MVCCSLDNDVSQVKGIQNKASKTATEGSNAIALPEVLGILSERLHRLSLGVHLCLQCQHVLQLRAAMLADISEWQIANIHAMHHARSGDSKDVCCVIRTEFLILGEDSTEGDESEKERLKAIARNTGVRDRVDFLGSVAHHELPFFYSAADVSVMPSYSESFGLVGLEAQACGLPVVGSDVTGLRSVIRDEVSGYLIAGHEPAEYAERIGRLLDDPELAQQMGRRGRLLAQRFSWTRTADRLQLLFERIIDRSQLRVHASARQE